MFMEIIIKVYGSLSQWNYLKLEIGILDSLLRQWYGFEYFNILNFSNIFLQFAIVFKSFEYFCTFLSLTTITGQRSFSSLGDGLLDRTFEAKNYFELFLGILKLLGNRGPGISSNVW